MNDVCRNCAGPVRSDNRYGICTNVPECRREYRRLWRMDNPPDPKKAKVYSAQWREKNHREPKRLRLDSQQGLCAWCGMPLLLEEAVTDHNHRLDDRSSHAVQVDDFSVRGEVHRGCNMPIIAICDQLLERGAIFPPRIQGYLTNDFLEYVPSPAVWDGDGWVPYAEAVTASAMSDSLVLAV